MNTTYAVRYITTDANGYETRCSRTAYTLAEARAFAATLTVGYGIVELREFAAPKIVEMSAKAL